MGKKQLEETAAFIREHRSNESGFSTLYAKLEEVIGAAGGSYKGRLAEVRDKQAEEYNHAKSINATAWPEFEKFVNAFEKAVVEELRNVA